MLASQRFTLLLLVFVAVVYGWHIKNQVTINTSLADVSPSLASSRESRQATESVSENIEKRILFMVSGNDEDQVLEASDGLSDALAQLDHLRLLPSNDELFEQLLTGLKPYRFGLLSVSQVARIEQGSPAQWIEQAKRDAFGIATTRFYPFIDDPFGLSSASLEEALRAVAIEPIAPQDGAIREIIPATLIDQHLNIDKQQALKLAVDQVVQQLQTDYQVEIDRSGVFFFAAEAAQASKQDISFITTASALGVVILLLTVFRRWSALALPFLSIALGIGVAFFATHFIYGGVHVLTIVFGASLIGIVVDYSLHYFYHSANQRAQSSESTQLHSALRLSLLTSIIGYAALGLSGLAALQKVAVFSCIGLFVAWLSVISLGPVVTRKGFSSHASLLTNAVAFLRAVFSTNRRMPLLVLGVALLLSGGFSFLQKPFNDNPRSFYDAPSDLLESERRVAAVANDFEPGRYILLVAKNNAALQERLQHLFALVKQAGLESNAFSNLMSLIPPEPQQKRAYQAYGRLLERNGAIDQLGEAIGLQTQAIADLRASYQAAQSKHLTPQIVSDILGDSSPPIWFKGDSGVTSFVLVRKGTNTEILEQLLSDSTGIEYVNTLRRTESALADQRASALTLLGLAYVLVALMLSLRFRSLRAASLVLVPLISTSVVFILAQVFNAPLNLFHVMSLFLVLGFGMDYTIFVREMQNHLDRTLQAILLSAITSLLSFGLLALSSVPVVASFGSVLLIGNSMNLLGAYVYASFLTPQTIITTK